MNKIGVALLEGALFKEAQSWWNRKTKKIRGGLDYVFGSVFRFFYSKKFSIIENQILFFSFQGNYSCNPKYICEEFIRRDPEGKYKIIISARKKDLEQAETLFPLGDNITIVEQFHADFMKAMMSSKIIVINSVEPFKFPIPKKKGQIVIETWHGSLGIKRFDKAHYKSSKAWPMAATKCGKNTDYVISNSLFEDNVYKETYWGNSTIKRFGHPRNDILVGISEKKKALIRKKVEDYYSCSFEGKKILLYAPTFRDDHGLEGYGVELTEITPALNKQFGGEFIIVVRLHPTIRAKADEFFRTRKEYVNATDYPDMQELIAIADVGITDYSSWIFDFMLTRRPGFLYASDLEEYMNERSFYYPLSATPFPLASTTSELSLRIEEFDSSKYEIELEDFLKDKGCVEDGFASKRTVDLMMELLET